MRMNSNNLKSQIKFAIDAFCDTTSNNMFLSNIVTLNGKGLLNHAKRKKMSLQLNYNTEILYLQETHSSTNTEKYFLNDFHMKNGYFSHGTTAARGAAILLNIKDDFSNIMINNQKYLKDEAGRIVAIAIEVKDRKVGLINCYAPNINESRSVRDGYLKYLDSLELILEQISNECDIVVLGGDFNILLDRDLDAKGGERIIYSECIDKVQELCYRFDLTDLSRSKRPGANLHTFAPMGKNARNIFRRLDYFFVSNLILDECTDDKINVITNSDHCAISFSIKAKTINSSGKGYWRHNDSLNSNVEFISYMKSEIRGLDTKDLSDNRAVWEYVKYKIRELSRNFSINKAKESKANKQKLQNGLDQINNQIMNDKTGNIEALKAALEEVRTKMEDILDIEAKSIMFRSKVKFIEQGEKVSSYFFRAVKQNITRSNIDKIKINNVLNENQTEVSKYIHQYYKDLYAANENNNLTEKEKTYNKFIHNNELPQISKKFKDLCDKPISKQEIKTTLFQRMNPGKSPGNDGLTVGILKQLWDELEDFFYDAAMESIVKGELTASQRQSIIRLIRKKDKDKLDIDNWRPISLLNVDTKIISKLLAVRIEKCLEDIIHEDQNAFVPNRYIGEGIRKLQYLCEYCDNEELGGALLSIDFRKAFDSVSHEYLWRAMEGFGFGANMINMIKLLYKGAESAVMNEGISSMYFNLERSCRQGDCLSPYLFIIAIEPLLKLIRDSTVIQGLQVHGSENRLTAYADDLTVIVQNREGVDEIKNLLGEFSTISGLEVNMGKSELMGLGSWKDEANLVEFGFKVVSQMKITGITIGHDKEIVEKLNFEPVIAKARAKLAQWKTRHLSLLGKVVAVKSHGLSLFQFVASIISVPHWVIMQINKIVYRFIWGGIDKISRKIACLPIKEGGINVPMMQDIVYAAHIQWIRRKSNFPGRAWAKFLDWDINKLGGYSILSGGLNKKIGLSKLLSFNQDILTAWSSVSNNPSLDNTEELLKVSLWHNSEIVDAKGKGIFFERLNNLGIKKLANVLQEDGSLIPSNRLSEFGIPGNMYLEWIAISKSIPKAWKDKLRDSIAGKECLRHDTLSEENMGEMIGLYDHKEDMHTLKKCTQKVIMTIINNARVKPINKFKAKMSEQYNISNDEWLNKYKYIMQWSISTRNRSFLWRFLYGIVYTNEDFCKFGFKDSNKCSFCNSDGQSKDHLFLSCPKVVSFRNEVVNKNNNIFKDFTLNDKVFMFGLDESPLVSKDCVNLIIALMNKYIYYNNFHARELSVYAFEAELADMEKVEYDIAARKGRLGTHLLKWEMINTNI
jgi:exonuclease III